MACGAHAMPATVEYIFDGDTFRATVHLDDDIAIDARVRISNVDTPEMNGECAYEIKIANRARDRLSELIPVGTRVELSEIKDDKYLGRIDAIVSDTRGRDVGRILVAEGLGRNYSGGKRVPWCKK